MISHSELSSRDYLVASDEPVCFLFGSFVDAIQYIHVDGGTVHISLVRSSELKKISLSIMAKYQSIIAHFHSIIGANSKHNGIAYCIRTIFHETYN